MEKAKPRPDFVASNFQEFVDNPHATCKKLLSTPYTNKIHYLSQALIIVVIAACASAAFQKLQGYRKIAIPALVIGGGVCLTYRLYTYKPASVEKKIDDYFNTIIHHLNSARNYKELAICTKINEIKYKDTQLEQAKDKVNELASLYNTPASQDDTFSNKHVKKRKLYQKLLPAVTHYMTSPDTYQVNHIPSLKMVAEDLRTKIANHLSLLGAAVKRFRYGYDRSSTNIKPYVQVSFNQVTQEIVADPWPNWYSV